MATISANKIRQEGISLVFRTNPAVGIIALTGFTDNATSGQYTKIFRYSKNGVTFSNWMPLTTGNLTAISITAKDVFVAEINYNTTNPSATVTTSTISDTLSTDPAAEHFYFDNSLFKRYFDINDSEVLKWYINVLEKLFDRGLIPNYIERLDDFGSPDDFLALWGAIAKFFSFYVKLARTFSKFYNNADLIRDFLKQRGLNTSPEDTLTQLQYMLETYYFQMAQRGTERMVHETVTTEPMGEILRLIYYKKELDEFLFLPYRKHFFGWNVGNCSPLHKGLRINDNINKVPWSKGYVDVVNATSFITGDGVIISPSDEPKKISFTSTGSITFATADKAVKASPGLDYQISFQIKLSAGGTFNLNTVAFDKDGSPISSVNRRTGVASNAFLSTAVLSRSDKFLTVKAYLYNNQRPQWSGDRTSIKQGNNLISNANMVKLGFTIQVDGAAEIFDIRMVPMQTEYSRGFLQVNNFISTWLYNRNGEL